MSETIHSQESSSLQLYTPEDMVRFFEQKELEDPEKFMGYKECAHYLAHGIQVTAEESRGNNEEFLFSIPLKPAIVKNRTEIPNDKKSAEYVQFRKDASPIKVYDGQEPQATTALMFAAYKSVLAEEVLDTRSDDQKQGHVVIHGLFQGGHIYFVEEYGKDDWGNYMSWNLRSSFPEELVPEKTDSYPELFISTEQEHELYDWIIESLPIETVDEPKAVVTWLRQRKSDDEQDHKAA